MKRRILPKEAVLSPRRLNIDLTAQEVTAPPFVLKQEPMPNCLERWTGNLLYWVTSLGAQYYAEVVAPYGLLPSHVAVLEILNHEGPMRQARLTDKTRIDRATMVGLLNELEQEELIERRAAPNDKRAFDIYLTERGKQCSRQIEKVSAAAEEQFYGVLSLEERQTLRKLLKRLTMRDHQKESD